MSKPLPVCTTSEGNHLIPHILEAWEIRIEARKVYNQNHGRAAKIRVLCTKHADELFDRLQSRNINQRAEIEGQEALL
jgi:hypothetical protein